MTPLQTSPRTRVLPRACKPAFAPPKRASAQSVTILQYDIIVVCRDDLSSGTGLPTRAFRTTGRETRATLVAAPPR